MKQLTDYFLELVAYVAYFSRSAGKRQPPFEQVQADIQRLMNDIDNRMHSSDYSQPDFDPARFAVVAWVDETIMNSQWAEKGQWQKALLQKQYYQTTDAGELFFERLNTLGPHQHDVREVYYLCLALGFKGRYCLEGDDFLLDQLKTSNLKLLTGSSVGIPSLASGELFPEAYPIETEQTAPGKQRAGLSKFTLIGFSLPVALFAALLVVYQFILGSYADNLLK